MDPYLSSRRRIRLVKHGPDFGFRLLPPGEVPGVVVVLEAELLGRLLRRRLLRVQVQTVQHRQSLLCITMLELNMEI